MRIGRSIKSQELVFSLEKVDPSSSSSSSLPSSSSSSGFENPPQSSSSSAGPQSSSSSGSENPPQSSSSSLACGPFGSSITTEIGINPEIPTLFYGESVGVSLVSVTDSITLNYDNLNVSGPAFIMDIQIGTEIVASATVAFGIGSNLYLGKPFSINYLGSTYCGVFTNGTVVF